MQDAAEVMELLLKVQTEQGEELEDDDPQVEDPISLCHSCYLIGSTDFIHDQCVGPYVQDPRRPVCAVPTSGNEAVTARC